MKKFERNKFASFLLAGLCALSAGLVLSACSSSMVSDLDTSKCGSMDSYQTRGAFSPTYLMITSAGNDLHCALHNYLIHCGEDASVKCENKGSLLLLNVEGVSRNEELISHCSCEVSVYFTINDVNAKSFKMRVEQFSKAGEFSVDMEGHETAMINLTDGGIIYDNNEPDMSITGCRIMCFPEILTASDTIRLEDMPGIERKLSLYINREFRFIWVDSENFYAPCGAEQKNLVGYMDEDGSFVIDTQYDIPYADTMVRNELSFYIINAREQFHLKLFPHQVTTTDADGTVHEVTTYEYEGDIDFSGGEKYIEITY